ncbi:MAG TPA: hypothetical protein VET24_04930 [Actinomycetota bacterium]|nr:hypothetical protein [Actinomycetota bacterium]
MRIVPPGRRSRAAGLGLVIALAYLVVGGLSFRGGLLPRAPVLDGGQPPPPYQWVKPPPDRVKDNVPPSGVTGTIPLTVTTTAGSVTTPDYQAQLISDSNSIPRLPGQTSVKVTIDPLDPTTVWPPPPGDHDDSNAYRFSAVYGPSNQPLTTMSVTVVLSYATNADHIFRWNGSAWAQLPSTPSAQNQLFSPTDALGVFVAAGPGPAKPAAKATSPVLLVLEVAVPFAVIVIVLVAVLGRRRMSGTPPPPPARRR